MESRWSDSEARALASRYAGVREEVALRNVERHAFQDLDALASAREVLVDIRNVDE